MYTQPTEFFFVVVVVAHKIILKNPTVMLLTSQTVKSCMKN
eukprot:SAG11_NODE_37251_length_257_cov_7.126582_1_plen_40_part_01